MINFLKLIGIIPAPITWYCIKETLFILFFGISIIILFTKILNVNFPIKNVQQLFDNNLTNWEKRFYKSLFWKYPLWACVQQLVVVLIFVLLRKFMSDFNAVIVASALFVLMHFPNLFLGLAVFGMEQVLLNYFLIFRNIYFIALIHGVFGTLLCYLSPSILYTKFPTWYDYYKLYKKD